VGTRKPNHGRDLLAVLILDAVAAVAVLAAPALLGLSATALTVLLIVCAVVALGATYWLLPQWQIPPDITGKERAELEDKARATLGSLIGSFALVATVGFTLLQLNETRKAQEDTLEATELGQLGERFSRAIEQLGSESLDVRLGGLYSLERFARTRVATFELTNLDDIQTVGRVVGAYIREHAKRRRPPRRGLLLQGTRCTAEPRAVPADVAAALDILRTLFPADEEVQFPRDNPLLNLAGVDLSGADLSEIDLQFADLSDAVLVRTVFRRAWLDQANLSGTDARGACFEAARLRHASFTAPPVRASIPGGGSAEAEPPRGELVTRAAALAGAAFTGSSMEGARLMYVDLRCSDLSNAEIFDARFDHADIGGVVTEGATPPRALQALLDSASTSRRGPTGTLPDAPERIAFCRRLVRP
jgi:uncharacterized protein YjbI with pentapeptide repeats